MMTEEELKERRAEDAKCEREAREFLAWIEGYLAGIGRSPTNPQSAVYAIEERARELERWWLQRSDRITDKFSGKRA